MRLPISKLDCEIPEFVEIVKGSTTSAKYLHLSDSVIKGALLYNIVTAEMVIALESSANPKIRALAVTAPIMADDGSYHIKTNRIKANRKVGHKLVICAPMIEEE